MAGDWIPITLDLPRKREVLLLCAKTGWSRYEVLGRLVEFWAWISAESTDGSIGGLTPDELAATRLFDRRFLSALEEVGWLSWSSTGLCIPNFGRWLSRSAKARLTKTLRQAAWRANQVDTPVDGRVDGRVDAPASTTEENRREEITELPGTETPAHSGSAAKVAANPPPDGAPDADCARSPPETQVVLVFPCVGQAKEWRLTTELLERLKADYPTVDVLAEARKAHAWIEAHPDRRKTARGMQRFLVGWLNRAVDRGGGGGTAAADSRPRLKIDWAKVERLRREKP